MALIGSANAKGCAMSELLITADNMHRTFPSPPYLHEYLQYRCVILEHSTIYPH